MPIIVQKYGGTSVEGPERILAVARRVADLRREGYDVVVVVSAQGATTDSLVREAQILSPEPAQRELDMLMTAGERISMSLLAIALNSIGCPAVSFTGSQVGIITDTRHTDARILEVRPHRVVRELERGSVVVVGGFQGVSTEKDVTTLGRGGSDTTAVALAAALGAERCEILTDVDGVYTADPRVVEGARRLDSICYEDMAELARYGARVLKEDAVRFAEREGIAIRIGGSSNEGPGTIVLERPVRPEDPVVGVSALSRVTLATWNAGPLPAWARGREPGPEVLFTLFAEGRTVVAARTPEGRGPRWEPAPLSAIEAAVLCLAGPAAGKAETLSKASDAIETVGERALAATASGRSALLAVRAEAADVALRAVHGALFGRATARQPA
jgi:uridylate kinase